MKFSTEMEAQKNRGTKAGDIRQTLSGRIYKVLTIWTTYEDGGYVNKMNIQFSDNNEIAREVQVW